MGTIYHAHEVRGVVTRSSEAAQTAEAVAATMDLSRPRIVDVNDVLEGAYRYAPRGRWCSVKDAFYGPRFSLAECLDLEQRELNGILQPHKYLNNMQRGSTWRYRPRVALDRRFDPYYDDCQCLSVEVALISRKSRCEVTKNGHWTSYRPYTAGGSYGEFGVP